MSRDMSTTGPTLGTPRWAGDFMSRDHLLPAPAKLNAADFNTVVVTASAASAAATTVTVAALSAALPSGTILNFGTNKFARLTAAAAKGATSVTVAAIPTALAGGETATVTGISAYVPSGTLVSRTIAERDAGTGYGPYADTDPASETYLTAFDIDDVSVTGDAELYRPGATVYENYLPDWTTLSAAAKVVVRARYLGVVPQE